MKMAVVPIIIEAPGTISKILHKQIRTVRELGKNWNLSIIEFGENTEKIWVEKTHGHVICQSTHQIFLRRKSKILETGTRQHSILASEKNTTERGYFKVKTEKERGEK